MPEPRPERYQGKAVRVARAPERVPGFWVSEEGLLEGLRFWGV